MSKRNDSSQPVETASGRARKAMFHRLDVIGLLFDWIVAIGQYVFTVLLLGLVGGYFGGFADVGLYFIGADWVGRGRELGWVIGAVGGAIGLPTGWVRCDDKRFSWPTPRKLRRRVSAGMQRRRRKNNADQVSNMADLVQHAGSLGLVGAFLGFLLGMGLMMCWFSVSMSPFAPQKWAASIAFESQIDTGNRPIGHPDERGPAITSDHLLLWYLVFTPVVVLGGTGAIAGTIHGAWTYVGYSRTVPAAIRARREQTKRRPVVQQREAYDAAHTEGLPVIAVPPRSIPIRVHAQLLRGGVGVGLVAGAACSVAGALFTGLIAVGELKTDTGRAPLIAVVFPLIFACLGVALFVGCVRAWRRKAAILREGYLARCRIVTCRIERSAEWKPLEKAFDELYRTWHRPLVTAADAKQLKMVGGCVLAAVALFATALVSFLGYFVWDVSGGEWFMLAPALLLLVVVVCFAFVFRYLKRFFFSDGTPSQRARVPLVDCRFEFQLPGGVQRRAEGRLDMQGRLDSGSARPDDVAVYHPCRPEHAFVLSRFRPALGVNHAGQWQFSRPPVERGDAAAGRLVYITPSGGSYHRGDCRFVENKGSSVPLRYAQRYYEPCGACRPPEA